jgi:hypothetical protein
MKKAAADALFQLESLSFYGVGELVEIVVVAMLREQMLEEQQKIQSERANAVSYSAAQRLRDDEFTTQQKMAMRGVRVDGDKVVIAMKGGKGRGNEAARRLCGEILARHGGGERSLPEQVMDILRPKA